MVDISSANQFAESNKKESDNKDFNQKRRIGDQIIALQEQVIKETAVRQAEIQEMQKAAGASSAYREQATPIVAPLAEVGAKTEKTTSLGADFDAAALQALFKEIDTVLKDDPEAAAAWKKIIPEIDFDASAEATYACMEENALQETIGGQSQPSPKPSASSEQTEKEGEAQVQPQAQLQDQEQTETQAQVVQFQDQVQAQAQAQAQEQSASSMASRPRLGSKVEIVIVFREGAYQNLSWKEQRAIDRTSLIIRELLSQSPYVAGRILDSMIDFQEQVRQVYSNLKSQPFSLAEARDSIFAEDQRYNQNAGFRIVPSAPSFRYGRNDEE